MEKYMITTFQYHVDLQREKKYFNKKKFFPDQPTLFFGGHLLPETHNFFFGLI